MSGAGPGFPPELAHRRLPRSKVTSQLVQCSLSLLNGTRNEEPSLPPLRYMHLSPDATESAIRALEQPTPALQQGAERDAAIAGIAN